MAKKRKPLKKENDEKKKGGRPPLSEVTVLSGDMKEIAMLAANGYTPGEIAERLGTSGNRVNEVLKNPLVKKRIMKERNDFMTEWAQMREDILSETYRGWLALLRTGKAKASDLKWLLERLEDQEGIYVSERPDGKKSKSEPKKNIKKEEEAELETMDGMFKDLID